MDFDIVDLLEDETDGALTKALVRSVALLCASLSSNRGAKASVVTKKADRFIPYILDKE